MKIDQPGELAADRRHHAGICFLATIFPALKAARTAAGGRVALRVGAGRGAGRAAARAGGTRIDVVRLVEAWRRRPTRPLRISSCRVLTTAPPGCFHGGTAHLPRRVARRGTQSSQLLLGPFALGRLERISDAGHQGGRWPCARAARRAPADCRSASSARYQLA